MFHLMACSLAWVRSQLNLHVHDQHIDWRRLDYSLAYMSVTNMSLLLLIIRVIAIHRY